MSGTTTVQEIEPGVWLIDGAMFGRRIELLVNGNFAGIVALSKDSLGHEIRFIYHAKTKPCAELRRVA